MVERSEKETRFEKFKRILFYPFDHVIELEYRTYPKFPPSEEKRKKLEKNLVETAKRTQGIFLFYLTLCTYALLTLMSVKDIAFFSQTEGLKLPIFSIEVPPEYFFPVMAFFLLVVKIYYEIFNEAHYRIRRILAIGNNELFGDENRDFEYPWLGNFACHKGFIGDCIRCIYSFLSIAPAPIITILMYWRLLQIRFMGAASALLLFAILTFVFMVIKVIFHTLMNRRILTSEDKYGYGNWRCAIYTFAFIIIILSIKIHVVYPHIYDLPHQQDPNFFSNPHFSTIELSHQLPNPFIYRIDLRGADLSNTRFTNTDFRYANLDEVNFSNSRLNNVQFDSANLYKANFSEARLNNVSLDHADLTRAVFNSVEIGGDAVNQDTTFIGAYLIEADFTNANLNFADFTNANLDLIDFTNAFLVCVDFNYAELRKARFTGAHLCKARFIEAGLSRSKFICADIFDIEFTNANLNNAEFSGVNLYLAGFKDAEIMDANFISAVLTFVDFSGAKNISDSNIQNVYLFYNKFPDSFTPFSYFGKAPGGVDWGPSRGDMDAFIQERLDILTELAEEDEDIRQLLENPPDWITKPEFVEVSESNQSIDENQSSEDTVSENPE